MTSAFFEGAIVGAVLMLFACIMIGGWWILHNDCHTCPDGDEE